MKFNSESVKEIAFVKSDVEGMGEFNMFVLLINSKKS